MIHAADFFGRLGVFSFRHAKTILVLSLVFSLGSAWFLKDLRFDTISAEFDVNDPEMKAYAQSMDKFGDSGNLLVRMAPAADAPLSSLNDWTDAVTAALSSWEDIRFVESSPTDFVNVPVAAAFLRAAVLNREPAVLELFTNKFKKGALERELRRHRKLLLTASDPELLTNLASDPLKLRELLEPHLKAVRGNMKLARSGSYLDAANGRSRILIIHPAGLSEDINYSQSLVTRVRNLMEETRIACSQPPEADFGLTGKYAQSADASRITIEDMRIISLIASLLIFFLIWVVFRRARAVFIAVIPLALSLIASFVFARLFFNPLSPVAMAFAAILLGLGIDIVLHCTGRIFQVFPKSPSLEEAIRLTLEDCGPPIAIGVTTTAAAFYCLTFAEFEAISQFGLLTSGSLMITLVVSLFIFPASVRLLFPGKYAHLYPRFQKMPVKLFSFSAKRPFIALGIGLVVLMLSLLSARDFRFEMDVFKGIPDSMPSMEVANDIALDFGASLVINSQILIEASSLKEAMTAQEDVDKKLAELVRTEKIAGFESPSLFLPYPESMQRNKIDLAALGSLIEKGRQDFFSLLASLKIRSSSQMENYYAILEAAFPPGGLPSPDAFIDTKDPRIGKHIKKQDGIILQTYIWPTDKDGDLSKAKDITTEFAGFSSPNSSRIRVTGVVQFYEKLNEMMRSDFFRVSLISLAAILFLSSVFLRHLPTIFLSLLPLLCAIPFTFAVLVIFGLSFTPAGIGITAMVLGIGIDDTVHILVRMRNKPLTHLNHVIRDIGPILFLTTFSTMLGFGALSLSRLYSIRSMGVVVALGVLACLLFTILFIPSLLKLSRGKKSNPPKSVLLLIFSLLTITGSAAPHPVLQESRLEKILNSLEKKYNTTEAFAYSFDQVKFLQQLTEPMEFKGTLVFRKPHFIRMEMRGEENLNLYVNGEFVWMEDLDFEEVDQFDFAEINSQGRLTRILPPVFVDGISTMKEKFQVRLDETMDQDVLELIPLESHVSPLRSIRFAVGSFSRILWMRTDYTNGDWTETRFSGWKNMPKISEHYFRYRKKN
jgi:uncharacterized protein